jgi:hypothetical protein
MRWDAYAGALGHASVPLLSAAASSAVTNIHQRVERAPTEGRRAHNRLYASNAGFGAKGGRPDGTFWRGEETSGSPGLLLHGAA